MRNINLKQENKKYKKFSINKADLFIYILALIAFILMIVVLIANRTQDLTAITYLFNDTNYDDSINENSKNEKEIVLNEDEIIYNKDSYLENIDNENNSKIINDYTSLSKNYEDNIDEKDEEDKEDINFDDVEKETSVKNSEIVNENSVEKNIDTQFDNQQSIELAILSANDVKIENRKGENDKNDIYNQINKEIDKLIPDKNNQKNQLTIQSTNEIKIESKEDENDKSDIYNQINKEIDKLIPDKNNQEDKLPVQSTNKKIKDKKDNKNDKEIIYKVQKGDAMWKIAKKYSISNIKLIKYNNLSDPNFIYPGQEIRIPLNL